MQIPVFYVVQPTDELRRLSASLGIDHPFARDVHMWESWEHHRNRKHTPDQIAEATWLAFLGDFDLADLDSQGIDARPFLRECIKLGFALCFSIVEANRFSKADELFADAEFCRERANANLALLVL